MTVIGGSKLRKTSLVRTALDRLVDRMVIDVDLGTDPSPRFGGVPGATVVLDNLDNLADSVIEPLLARAAGAARIVVTGGRRLRTLPGHSETLAGMKFRLYPLSVLLDGETRALIGRSMSPLLADWTGNHPYLTKLLLHHVDDPVATCLSQWKLFVKHLVAELDEGPERQLLC